MFISRLTRACLTPTHIYTTAKKRNIRPGRDNQRKTQPQREAVRDISSEEYRQWEDYLPHRPIFIRKKQLEIDLAINIQIEIDLTIDIKIEIDLTIDMQIEMDIAIDMQIEIDLAIDIQIDIDLVIDIQTENRPSKIYN